MPDAMLATAAEPVLRWSRATPRGIAVIEHGTAYSYDTLARNVAQAAKTLAAAGLRPGMILGIDCGLQYLHLILILACEVLGAAHAMIEPSDVAPDSELLQHCDLLCVEALGDLLPNHPRVLRLSTEFVGTMLAQPIDGDDLAMLARQYPAGDLARIGKTSGTTGRPKFIGYSRAAVRSTVDIVPYLLKFDFTRQDFVSVYPFLMTRTYSDTMSAFRFGATVVYSGGSDLAVNMRSRSACHAFLLVGNAADLPSSAQFRDGRVDQCCLFVGGGFVPPRLRAALRDTVTTDLRVAYSTNETRDITLSDDDDGPGTMLPDVSVRVIDEFGRDVPPGEPGRVMVRTPRMANGYLWNDSETKAHFVDGWFLTSDRGFMPEPGKLTLLGRADDMINLGGVKLAPHPIEERIRAIDGVMDAVMVGVENAAGSGELHVFIERGDETLEPAIRAGITDLLIGHVALYYVHYLDRLPRTMTGKVQRNLLKQSLSG